MHKGGYVYIVTNKKNGTLYIGVTNNLQRRIYEHKNKVADGFTKKYNLNKLIFYEEYSTIQEAILRENQIKKRNRAWKIRLIEKENLEWKDMYQDIEDW